MHRLILMESMKIYERHGNRMVTLYTENPGLLLFFVLLAVTNILPVMNEKLRPVWWVGIAVHIASVFFYVKAGAELDDILLLFLFSILVGLVAELVKEKRANAKKSDNNAEGDNK